MMRIAARRLPAAIAAGAMLAALAGCAHGPPIPSGRSGPDAEALARSMSAAAGAAALDETGALAFTVSGAWSGHYIWDRARERVRVQRGASVVILDLASGRARAFDSADKRELDRDAHRPINAARRDWRAMRVWLDPWQRWFADDHTLERIDGEDGVAALVVRGPPDVHMQPQGGVWRAGPDDLPTTARLWRSEVGLAGVPVTWEDWITLPTGLRVARRHGFDGREVVLADVVAGRALADLGFDVDPFSEAALVALGARPGGAEPVVVAQDGPPAGPPAGPPLPAECRPAAVDGSIIGRPAPPRAPLCGRSWTEIATRFTPDVFFHPEEKYFPSSVEWYLQRSWLWTFTLRNEPKDRFEAFGAWVYENVGNQSMVKGRKRQITAPTFDDLLRAPTLSYVSPQSATGAEPDPQTLRGDLANAPFYVRVNPLPGRSDAFDIQYWFFFPYNGNIMGSSGTSLGSGHHEGDWEHIEVHVRNPGCDDAQIEGVVFAAHGDGGGLVTDFERQGPHPVVYGARGSHASYPTEGKHIRLGFIGSDPTGRGPHWPHTARVEVASIHPEVPIAPGTHRDTAPWVYFLGNWGQSVKPKKFMGIKAGASPRTPSYHHGSAWPGPAPTGATHFSPLRNGLNNLCLSVDGSEPGARGFAAACTPASARWGLTLEGELRLASTNRCLDADALGNLRLEDCGIRTRPRWWLTRQQDRDGLYRLRSRHGAGCLSLNRPFASAETRAIVAVCAEDDVDGWVHGVQRWAFAVPRADRADGLDELHALDLGPHIAVGEAARAAAVHRARQFVSLAGAIESRTGQWGTVAHLPAELAPRARLVFGARGERGEVRVDVLADGRVVVADGADVGAWLSLAGIAWSTRSTRAMNLSFLARALGGEYAGPSADRVGDVVALAGAVRLDAEKALPGQPWPVGNVGINQRPDRWLSVRARTEHGSVEVRVDPDGVIWARPETGDLGGGWLSLAGIRYATRRGEAIRLTPGVRGRSGTPTASAADGIGILDGVLLAERPGEWGLIGGLPEALRPSILMSYVADAGAHTARVDLHPDGRICVLPEGADLSAEGQPVSLSGLAWPLAR